MAVSAKPEQSVRVPFHQGLLESQESSKVPVGFATELVNWVPEATGALRVRGAWQKGSLTGAPSVRQNRGIGTFNRFTDPSIVQVSTPVKTKINTNAGAITPSVSWATPTTVGNTLLCVVAIAMGNSTGSSTFTFTAGSGWSVRNQPSTTSPGHTAVGVMEIASAAVQTGAQSPFTVRESTGKPIGVIAWLVELAGVTTFDKSGLGLTTSGSSVTGTLSGASAQASEILLAVDSSTYTSLSGNTVPWTLSTASTGWAEITEDGQQWPAGDGFEPLKWQEAGLYYGTRQTISTPSITVDSTVGATDHTVLLLAYRGWNAAASPEPAAHHLLTANYNGSTSDIYAVDRDTLASATFAIVDAARPSSGEPVAFVMGMGGAHYTAASFAGIRRWNGVTATTITGSPIGGRCIAINHDRMWVGGTPAYPARLLFSQLLDAGTWTGTGTGFWDIGTDDGEFIEDITPFNDGLMIGKERSLWFLSGTTTTDFARSQLPAGGAAPGRSLLTTPFGCVIAGRDMVWLYDGSTVQRLGNAVERSYGVTGPFVTMSYEDGSVYVADPTAGKVFVFDLGGTVGTWRVEECGDDIAVLYNVGGTQYMGPYSSGNGSLINFRSFPDPIRGKDYDSLSETFTARTGDLWLSGSLNGITPRQLYLQLRQRADGITGLSVTPYFDGVAGQPCDVGPTIQGTARVAVEGFAQKGRVSSIGFSITQTLGPGETSCFDIEDAWIEYIKEGRG